ncbi:hypothetical protein B0H13DRAFT_1860003 [Mycena leptocephala]|nr:hypothetical protein B0H13DRAFT_1860003 [Mycena leptocephala]
MNLKPVKYVTPTLYPSGPPWDRRRGEKLGLSATYDGRWQRRGHVARDSEAATGIQWYMSVQEMDLQNGHSVDMFKFDLTSTGGWFDRQMPSIFRRDEELVNSPTSFSSLELHWNTFERIIMESQERAVTCYEMCVPAVASRQKAARGSRRTRKLELNSQRAGELRGVCVQTVSRSAQIKNNVDPNGINERKGAVPFGTCRGGKMTMS